MAFALVAAAALVLDEVFFPTAATAAAAALLDLGLATDAVDFADRAEIAAGAGEGDAEVFEDIVSFLADGSKNLFWRDSTTWWLKAKVEKVRKWLQASLFKQTRSRLGSRAGRECGGAAFLRLLIRHNASRRGNIVPLYKCLARRCAPVSLSSLMLMHPEL